MSGHPLTPIFEPRSVGVIGASADPEKRGYQVVAALQRSGFAGPVYPVNPKGGEILGLTVARDVGEIATPPDLVYIATPAASVPDVVRACGLAGVRGAIVPAVGFRESGEEGAERERRLVAVARETGIRVVGPNTSGLLNTHIGLHMVGGEPLVPGHLAIVSQSGNVALDLMTSAAAGPVGVSIYVGPGNESDVAFHEILEFLGGHEPTRAIVLYLEGVGDGRALYETACRVTATTPIVVLKGGRSDAGERAARSHTGSVAGSYAVFRSLARQSGMIEVDASDELLPVGEALALQPAPPALDGASGFVVISDGGGHATLAADRFACLGVPLARLGADTREALEGFLGPAASARNPVDVAGAADRDPSVLVRVVEIAAADPHCAGILLSGLFGGYAIRFAESLAAAEREAADGLADAARAASVPIVVHSLYAPRAPDPIARLLELGVPAHGSLEIAATCCAALARRAGLAASAVTAPVDGAVPPAAFEAPGGLEPAAGQDDAAHAGRWLTEVEARDLVARHGVPIITGVFCHDEDEIGALPDFEGLRVLKIVSRSLPHKTEAGAVRLGLRDQRELIQAFRDCSASALRYLADGPDAGVDGAREGASTGTIEGALITEMLPTPLAELLVGARRDPAFGPILTIGLGGVDVELFGDVAIRALPVAPADIEAMCRELARAPLLFGYRGAPAIDMAALCDAACALGRSLEASPELIEVELNPVFAYEDAVVAVDAAGRATDAVESPAADDLLRPDDDGTAPLRCAAERGGKL